MSFAVNLRFSLFYKLVRAEIRPGVRLFSDAVQDSEAAGDAENQTPIDPAKDRTKVVPLETSMRYMQSKAYKTTYGENPVWTLYRRNHKGVFAPRKTRKSCVRNGMISTGNPCPICRDEYLVLHHQNTKLLEQFISEHTGQVFHISIIYL